MGSEIIYEVDKLRVTTYFDPLQPSTFENLVPDYTDFDKITETVIFPSSGSGPGGIGGSGGGGVKFDHSLWQEARNGTGIWSTGEIQIHNLKIFVRDCRYFK